MKPHYPILDGLRGTAAIMVVIYHLFEAYFPVVGHHPTPHGYLAVDFFYLLSGFVVGYAYDDRWGKMSIKEFFKIRLIRLHPLVILGVLIGAIGFWFDPFTNLGHQVGIFRLIVVDAHRIDTLTIPGRSWLGRNTFAGRTLLVVIAGVYCQSDLRVIRKKNDEDYFMDYCRSSAESY